MLDLILWIIIGVYLLGFVVWLIFPKIETEDPKPSDRWLVALSWPLLIVYVAWSVRKGRAKITRTKTR